MGNIAKYFDISEFSCKCGCGKDDIDLELVKRLDHLREQYGKAIVITSGCRCEEHNKAVGGKHDSSHLYGKAADIKISDSAARLKILSIASGVFNKEVLIDAWLFNRIGIGSNFIHVDVDKNKPQCVCWLY